MHQRKKKGEHEILPQDHASLKYIEQNTYDKRYVKEINKPNQINGKSVNNINFETVIIIKQLKTGIWDANGFSQHIESKTSH